jgi:hypothetical protein
MTYTPPFGGCLLTGGFDGTLGFVGGVGDVFGDVSGGATLAFWASNTHTTVTLSGGLNPLSSNAR